ncbi:DNA-deoxyinosine glycosylase [Uliginosibacterium sp. 31-16]|uniref:DNA-deoxyinosine glycosylase n=1 Tax=Uliginosibacterium sp. 31-16 TaxID=3068315 RepID=UPI00273D48C8|nr:DNA-deoxyinosine glycosylase [Uliginosibacterium sp. 31-16]MDP5240570.1 DNA-deoxyinosine glycosylase [Uliginosibacterium sp. 31-16]
MRVCSFPPLAAPNARILILGSMPGVASLQAQRYYAHPHNRFWPIMGEALGFDPAAPYAERCTHLVAAGVAVWDVLQSCVRPGSLDADIDATSVLINDFTDFFAAHPQIRRVCFNGGTAESLFRRHVRPPLASGPVDFLRLPSTSPAHAGMRPAEKLAAWKAALDGGLLLPSN